MSDANVKAAGVNSPRRVMLAVAAYDGRVHVEFMNSVIGSIVAAAEDAGWIVTLAVRSNDCHVDTAYNHLLKQFLDSECECIVTVGSDQGWRPQDFVKLLRHDRDIVGGAPPKKEREGEAYPVLIQSETIRADSAGLVECHTLGTGFLKLSRKAVETLAKGALIFDGGVPQILERQIIGGKLWSGDNVLCLKARAAGFRVWLDPEMHFEHVGSKVWTGCIGDYWRRTNGL